eukprot:4702943-Amphidinium_carterae.1
MHPFKWYVVFAVWFGSFGCGVGHSIKTYTYNYYATAQQVILSLTLERFNSSLKAPPQTSIA